MNCKADKCREARLRNLFRVRSARKQVIIIKKIGSVTINWDAGTGAGDTEEEDEKNEYGKKNSGQEK